MADIPEDQIKAIVDRELGPIQAEVRTLNHKIDGLAWAYEVFVMNALRSCPNPKRFARDLSRLIDAEQARPDVLKDNRPHASDVPAVYTQSLGRLREIVRYFKELVDSGERAEEALDLTMAWWGGGPSWRSFERVYSNDRRDMLRLVRSKGSIVKQDE